MKWIIISLVINFLCCISCTSSDLLVKRMEQIIHFIENDSTSSKFLFEKDSISQICFKFDTTSKFLGTVSLPGSRVIRKDDWIDFPDTINSDKKRINYLEEFDRKRRLNYHHVTCNLINNGICLNPEFILIFDVYNDNIIEAYLEPLSENYSKYHKSISYIFLFDSNNISDYIRITWFD